MTPEPIELKPCPFCGEPPGPVQCATGAIVRCLNYKCSAFAEANEESLEEAVRVWNTRAPSELESLRAEVERAKRDIGYLERRDVIAIDALNKADAELARLRAELEQWKKWGDYASRRFTEETGKDLQAQST